MRHGVIALFLHCKSFRAVDIADLFGCVRRRAIAGDGTYGAAGRGGGTAVDHCLWGLLTTRSTCRSSICLAVLLKDTLSAGHRSAIPPKRAGAPQAPSGRAARYRSTADSSNSPG